jgi:hypothetical protein
MKGFCIYHREDFDRFTEEQKQKLVDHHGKAIEIVEGTRVRLCVSWYNNRVCSALHRTPHTIIVISSIVTNDITGR